MNQTDADVSPSKFPLDRRELMKLGVGAAVVAALPAAPAAAQGRGGAAQGPAPAPGSMRAPGEISPFTGPGYKNTADRLGGNGPMDDTTRKIVKFVHEFNASKMTPAAMKGFNRTMIDSMASLVAGFEEEPCRIAAKVAKLSPPGPLKSTVLGYGIETTPEYATFANGCLIRMVDFNDNAEGGHTSTLIPVALAFGEALHSTGEQVMEAIVVGYEVASAPAGGESVIAAMVAGKLMGLDEDRLANALTIALTPHIALNKGVGAMSMWKGTRSAESAKCGAWAAILAREGMTGPPQPFEGRGGLWASRGPGGGGGGEGAPVGGQANNGMGREFTMPTRADSMAIERNWFKRRPSEASSQGILVLMKDIRAWVKPDEIAAIHWDTSYGVWEEICDAPKWDPRNRETADHSEPFIIARALLDGDIYMDSFDEAKYNDPAARALMDKTTMAPVNGWNGLGMGRLTITKKSGETKYWDTYDGKRNLQLKDYPPFTEQELVDKFNRACTFMKMADAQRDQAYKVWSNLSAVKNFGDAIQSLAKFGQPKPL
jgi:2-methylcitrate dehydratase